MKAIPHLLSLALCERFEPLAEQRGVSEVARSERGFMSAYKEAGGDWNALDPWWQNRRNNFVKRHVAQMEANGEPLWEDDGTPTRRHLGLIMWAHSPVTARELEKHMARHNPSRGTLSKAEASWRMWHQKEPRDLHEVVYNFPERVFCVGTAETIIYESDKWEKDGRFFDYVHEFDSKPEVYMTEGVRQNPDVPSASVKRLLGTRDLEGELALPILGHVKEIIISPSSDDPDHCIRFRDNPIMCCTADHKTVVIFSEKKGPIFIRGGRMVVTERGIVR